jgi:hypothetical protein
LGLCQKELAEGSNFRHGRKGALFFACSDERSGTGGCFLGKATAKHLSETKKTNIHELKTDSPKANKQ